jgi:lysophospholipase L1-like esterase
MSPERSARSRRRRWWPNVALAAGSTVLMLLGVEVVARVAYYRRPGGKEQAERTAYVDPDPLLGWRKRPGARVTYKRREYTVEVAINSKGLHDVERDYEKTPGTFRILAAGDSMVEGYTVPFEQTVTQVLERELGAGGACPVEAINGGTTGYSTDQEYLFYRAEGRRYTPDVVLVFFLYNDLLANTTPKYWGAPKPLLAQRGRELAVTNFPVPSPYPGPPPEPAVRAPIQASAALQWVRERVAQGAPRAYDALARMGLWKPLGGLTFDPDDQMRVFKRRRQPRVEEAWDLADAILRAFAREAEADGARFAAVYVPARFEVSDRDWELTRLQFGLDETVWHRGLVRERLTAIGAAAGFPVLDLTPALRAADRGLLGQPYFIYDGHWNAAGHRAAAQAVASDLSDLGWLPACPARRPPG